MSSILYIAASSLSSSSSSSFIHFNSSKSIPFFLPSNLNPHFPIRISHKPLYVPPLPLIRASSSSSSPIPDLNGNPLLHAFKNYAKITLLITVTASIAGKFSRLPARAESPPPPMVEPTPILEISKETDEISGQGQSEAVEAMKSLLQQKLENGEDEEALVILNGLISAQPSNTEWKFLAARLLNEIGQSEKARDLFEEILAVNPLSFEALFENALLMDRCKEGDAVINRLQQALKIAEDEEKTKEGRDVRLIMAQVHFLQKNVEEALRIYQELAKEDPNDFRPYFCQGMIYSLLDKNVEAREQFAKYRELSPKKFEVDGYLRTPLSRMKLFGSESD